MNTLYVLQTLTIVLLFGIGYSSAQDPCVNYGNTVLAIGSTVRICNTSVVWGTWNVSAIGTNWTVCDLNQWTVSAPANTSFSFGLGNIWINGGVCGNGTLVNQIGANFTMNNVSSFAGSAGCVNNSISQRFAICSVNSTSFINGTTPIPPLPTNTSDPCINYGGTFVEVNSHISICTTTVAFGGWNNSLIKFGYQACTGDQWALYAPSSKVSSFGVNTLWINGSACRTGYNNIVYSGYTMSDTTCYAGNSSCCQKDTNTYAFAVCTDATATTTTTTGALSSSSNAGMIVTWVFVGLAGLAGIIFIVILSVASVSRPETFVEYENPSSMMSSSDMPKRSRSRGKTHNR